MTKHPFAGKKIKDYLSAFDITYDIRNMNNTLIVVANDLKSIISDAMYNKIISFISYVVPNPVPDDYENTFRDDNANWVEVLERLRYAMAPYAGYKHFIWLQLRITNNSITTYKSNEETTAFQYQKNEAKESLLVTYGTFLKELIDYLDANKDIFTEWKNSQQCKDLDNLLVKDYRTFDKHFYTNGDAAFFIRSRHIQAEEQVRVKRALGDNTDPDLISKAQRAVVYYTLGRCCKEFDNDFMPEPLRRALASEKASMPGRNFDYIKDRQSEQYKNIADSILSSINTNLAAQKVSNANTDVNIPVILPYKPPRNEDKFVNMT